MSISIKSILKLTLLTGLAGFIFSGCAAVQNERLAYQCSSGLTEARAELEDAKLKGFSSRVAWTKAATLLAAADIQQQFDKYPNCVNKVARARYYIRRSQAK
ncbi:hypothetical protein MNBD_GAMMA23-596 [hydrothermal vent metagenome]|uniref:Lipoprotein n=1 Tax=hydrothermal vent metagenome TaxID=652676 RepID=A0A3B1AUR0_9ZZZZ